MNQRQFSFIDGNDQRRALNSNGQPRNGMSGYRLIIKHMRIQNHYNKKYILTLKQKTKHDKYEIDAIFLRTTFCRFNFDIVNLYDLDKRNITRYIR